MICVAALIVFSILSIFSAKYRPLAKEALLCTFNLIRSKPCETDLKTRVRAKVSSKILKRNKKLGKFVYKYFSLLSLIFVILFLLSTIYTGIAVYNLIKYGTCNPSNPASCIFTGHVGKINVTKCSEECGCEQDINCFQDNCSGLNECISQPCIEKANITK